MVLLCAMGKEHMAIQSALQALAPTVELVERALVEKAPFAVYRYTLRLEERATEWTFHLIETGIGKVHAALATQRAIELYHPKLLVNVGVSGGLYAGAQVCDLCLSTAYRYHDVWCGEGNERGQVQGMPAQFSADVTAVETMAKQLHIPLHQGLLLCGDTFIPDAEHLRAFAQQYPDLVAVDMESAAIAQTAYLYQTPLVSIRIVSDTPLTSQDHGKQYADFWRQRDFFLAPFADAMRLVCSLAERL
ncbi:5'-methylthioadenosine/S-adenosylhomocysteine nucleosidase [Porphyromonas asaccharolytica]|uniref:adenosylhomocysteine nucleosidase n=1 Tax=Porphyromonas asaccharolytica (strain ATCC 25260 / DSM 20707 / BCRC 10618 / CCUG 7834 / JCM 6326 / LMG 13178 / VPI 4198 / B440) TaxID=879243 RepID=F4KM62_PORAD|nr:5'-methylthioadenosine/S-adenosylhomocysteine nucleosidase [Porphyromonas asaccharolytica]AEE13228.1 MTA/SAH nucleosidase [Porphyromonas asaccharolytica DSM 20707]